MPASYVETIGDGYDERAPKPKKTECSFWTLVFSFVRVSWYKMADSRDDSYAARLEDEITSLPDQEIGRFQRLLKKRGRAASAAPVHDLQLINTDMFVRKHPPKLMRRENLAVFIKYFQTRACYQRCDEALETYSKVRTDEVTRIALEEIIHGKHLVAQPYMV